VVVKRTGHRPIISIDHNGSGLSRERLNTIANALFAPSSNEVPSDVRGVLGFQHLGVRCDILSRTESAPDTYALRLVRNGSAAVEVEQRKPLARPGTSVVVTDLHPAMLNALSVRGLVNHLRARHSDALTRGDYEIEVVDGLTCEVVTPDSSEGRRLELPTRPTLWGRIEFALYVTSNDWTERRVSVVGRGGATVLDDVSVLDELSTGPWASDQVSGRIVFDGLQSTSRGIVRDRDAFAMFVAAVRAVESQVHAELDNLVRVPAPTVQSDTAAAATTSYNSTSLTGR
jgi:hypothetical protein